jgi:hypothetical protein
MRAVGTEVAALYKMLNLLIKVDADVRWSFSEETSNNSDVL